MKQPMVEHATRKPFQYRPNPDAIRRRARQAAHLAAWRRKRTRPR